MKKFLNAHSDKHAFTLAEVLITLGVIGIVAALTIPTLVTKYQKKVVETRLKKFYSSMNQAITLSEIENGTSKNWDYSLDGITFFDKYIRDYIKINTEQNQSEFLSDYTMTMLNGSSCDAYVWCSQKNGIFVSLSDGVILGLVASPGLSHKIFVSDVNGYNKPNVVGKDIFIYAIEPKFGKLYPYGYKGGGIPTEVYNDLDKKALTNPEDLYACNLKRDGVFCSGLIMYDNWEIKDDYPW